jgi:hypothetical protein
MKKITYQIRKTLIEKKISVILNNSLGSVLEIDNFDHASHMCQVMNSNTHDNCKYELIVIQERTKDPHK